MKRRIPLDIILGVTINKLTDEFVLHGVNSEYDYFFISQRRSEILEILEKAYFIKEQQKLKFFIHIPL